MMETMNFGALFVSAEGVSYRLFIHNCPEKEEIANLIERGFGTVESCPVGVNTLVLAAPGYRAGKNEVFSIEYVRACCSRKKKLDIKNFRLNETSAYNTDFNPMDVLEGIFTWSEAEKYRSKSPPVSQLSLLANDCSDNGNDGAFMETGSQLRRQRQYSLAHEKAIVEFVIRHEAYDMVKGNALWKVMEEKQICGGRTWQSMREHFLKKILSDIESFNLSETQITRFKNVNCSYSRRPRRKLNFKNSVFQESNDIPNRRIGSSITNSDKQSSFYTEHPDGQEDQCIISRKMKYYTEAEDKNLLKFIVQHERYKAARGVRLWKLMERKKALPGRSWQSMRERYQKVLIHKLEECVPSDVATQMLEADLGGTKQKTKKRRALATPQSLSLQRHTQMTEPAAGVSQTYSAYPTTNFMSLSGRKNTSKSSVDRKELVVAGTQNKKDSKQNLTNSSKRKLFSQRKSVMEFTPTSESEKSTRSSEYQSPPVAQVHHSTLNRKSDEGGSSRCARYAAVAHLHNKSQHNKNITTHGTRKSDGAVHNTEHTCQENVAWKSDRLFRKLGVSKESSVLQKEGNLPEFRGALEESALDNASNGCNLYVVSGKGKDSEINMHPCHSNSAQEIPEEEGGGNYVRNVPTEEQAVLSKERKTEVMSCQREQQAEFINDHSLENMPRKETTVQSKSSRHMLQSHRVTKKLSCGRSQYEVMSEKTSCEQNIRDLSGNFTQKMTNCMKTRNTDQNTNSGCISQNSCHEGTNVCSSSHDDSLNEEDTGVMGTEHNNVKLKHIVPNNENTTRKSPESVSDERKEIHEEYQENSTNLICIQPLGDRNDHGEVQGIENMHDTVNIDGNRKNGGDISLRDVYKIYKENGGQLSYQEYIKEILIACAHDLGYTEINFMGSNGKEQESHYGHTAEHASEQNAVMRLSPANNRTATNTYIDTLHTQQHPTVNKSEGPEYPVGRIICSTSQNGRVTCTGCSDREIPDSSSLKSVSCSDVVTGNIKANASPEQPTHCCSSQTSMSPSSSLSPEESSHNYKKGIVVHEAATTRKCADVIDMGQPVSSAHSNTGSCDWLEFSAEISD